MIIRLGIRLEGIAAVIVFGVALLTVLQRQTSPGLAGFSLTYALMMTGIIGQMVRFSAEFEMSMNSVERLVYYSELPQDS